VGDLLVWVLYIIMKLCVCVFYLLELLLLGMGGKQYPATSNTTSDLSCSTRVEEGRGHCSNERQKVRSVILGIFHFCWGLGGFISFRKTRETLLSDLYGCRAVRSLDFGLAGGERKKNCSLFVGGAVMKVSFRILLGKNCGTDNFIKQ